MGKITFYQCIMQGAAERGFVEQFDRLMECSLSKVGKHSPIIEMIDEATGFYDHQMALFVAFIYDVVWTRLPVDLLDLESDPGPQVLIPLLEFERAHP